MMKADAGWTATYDGMPQPHPVVAWDDEGNALVVLRSTGELIRAIDLKGLARVEMEGPLMNMAVTFIAQNLDAVQASIQYLAKAVEEMDI
jgi:hypothetical protein